MEKALFLAKKLIPKRVFKFFQPAYHYGLAFLGAVLYRFPAQKIKVVFITGTKGKSTTAEILNAILEQAGMKTAVAGTVRFKIGERSEPNRYKMTIPGRFFVQKFLRRAVRAKCDVAIIEMTSEGARQFRHKFIDLDALIFTNLALEHIESHGSYEKYREAKLSIAKALGKSAKREKIIVANVDDKEGQAFLDCPKGVQKRLPYSLKDAEPFVLKENGLEFQFAGEKIVSHLRGKFNLYNIIGASTLARAWNISPEIIKSALEKFSGVRGRVESVKISDKQNFEVIVDYAHTPDSLKALYEAFPNRKKICVLGNTGGGRDKWKRPAMGKIADDYCDEIILTNEDPYDENPRAIIDEVAVGMKKHKPNIIMDRREAVATALRTAFPDSVVLITGKGTDPYIMEANGKKTPWDDAEVAREELTKLIG